MKIILFFVLTFLSVMTQCDPNISWKDLDLNFDHNYDPQIFSSQVAHILKTKEKNLSHSEEMAAIFKALDLPADFGDGSSRVSRQVKKGQGRHHYDPKQIDQQADSQRQQISVQNGPGHPHHTHQGPAQIGQGHQHGPPQIGQHADPYHHQISVQNGPGHHHHNPAQTGQGHQHGPPQIDQHADPHHHQISIKSGPGHHHVDPGHHHRAPPPPPPEYSPEVEVYHHNYYPHDHVYAPNPLFEDKPKKGSKVNIFDNVLRLLIAISKMTLTPLKPLIIGFANNGAHAANGVADVTAHIAKNIPQVVGVKAELLKVFGDASGSILQTISQLIYQISAANTKFAKKLPQTFDTITEAGEGLATTIGTVAQSLSDATHAITSGVVDAVKIKSQLATKLVDGGHEGKPVGWPTYQSHHQW